MAYTLIRRLGAWALLLSLAACGGGGGDVPDAPVTLTPTDERVMVEQVERNSATTTVAVSVAGLKAGQAYYFAMSGGNALIADVTIGSSFPAFPVVVFTINFKSGLAPGDYTANLDFAVCSDPQCARPLAAAPVPVRLALTVKPNIRLPELVTLTRTGNEPAPTIRVPVFLPPEASFPSVSPEWTSLSGSGVELVGSDLVIRTQQDPAGTYEYDVVIWSSQLYRAIMKVRYVVLPPATGERPMSIVQGGGTNVSLEQGQTVMRRVQIEPASWTDVPVEFEPIGDCSAAPGKVILVQRISAYEFDITANASGADPSTYLCNIRFSAAPTGGVVWFAFQASVVAAF